MKMTTLEQLCRESARILQNNEIPKDATIGELGFDSLNFVELIIACEQIYGVIDIDGLEVEVYTTLKEIDEQVSKLAS